MSFENKKYYQRDSVVRDSICKIGHKGINEVNPSLPTLSKRNISGFFIFKK